MTPRRHRSNSNVSGNHAQHTRPQRAESPVVSAQQPKRQLGMTPAIYENNMKVLHRREPSITSIFDQFSHVCVYHHNGVKWEKQGYEGSMFLFEKQTYPPYGFFILNRMGTDDYIRPIHPEDDMDVMGDYLMYRYYPKFTELRIAMGLPYPIPPEQRPALDAQLLRQMTPEEVALSRSGKSKEWRGTSVTIGLWMFATDSREPLKDVMMRLHSYIKQGNPYPEEFRYGPGRPPPPNSHLRTASRASISREDNDSQASHAGNQYLLGGSRNQSQLDSSTTIMPIAAYSSGSELDKLFAKLMPSASNTPAPEVQSMSAASAAPASSISLQDLFASANGPHQLRAQPPVAALPSMQAPPTASTPNRGLALLDSIFASAAPTPPLASVNPYASPFYQAPPVAPSSSLPPHPEDIQIVSPKPTSSALPQILNQDVIASLLGLSSDSRASSVAPSSASSHHSNPLRSEGGTECSEGEYITASDHSFTSTTFQASVDLAMLAAGPSSGPTLLTVQNTVTAGVGPGKGGHTARFAEGDATPRAVARGIDPVSPPLQPQDLAPRSNSQAPASAPAGASANAAAAPSPAPSANPRTLVPFTTDSELWPYPRAPLDDRSLDADDADIVELDFADTRALSDPAMFSSRLKEKQSRAGGKEKKRKTREEREEERAKQREEIERGWDDPTKGEVQSMRPAVGMRPEPPSAPVPAPAPAVNGGGKTKDKHAVSGGKSEAARVNGHEARSAGKLDTDAAKQAIISAALSHQRQSSQDMSRNDFVRELLTLIHTDKGFVDKLWEEYSTRAH
ncbi:hypothetical protein WOLCODRAFT_139389 [Wolfiporia cocos MD-104 SS10]|uniref:Uncharacterized protein n=1 Tax=Wolfiporia cocos (strain MD-104) TaxID=742152 RepID=A0A2H3JSK0_WOLCO|nr:hypothetical protein WOLCODRAFT_139389 [Wolfiporia cocos MD-104 SS10]